MNENGGMGVHNADNLIRPLETGVVERFDAMFDAREKTLTRSVATLLANKQEFLTRTFPTLISIGAEHPQLSGGVLYMLGAVTKHIHGGSEAINSISRRFAERQATKRAKHLQPVLHELHQATEAAKPQEQAPWTMDDLVKRVRAVAPERGPSSERASHEQAQLVMRELKRARITRELYDVRQCPVDVRYDKEGKTVDLGRASSEISVLNKDSKTGKSMVFICSSAGNPAGAESFAVEYAMRTGDRVYVIGQPDGASGFMSREFADAAVSDAMPPAFDPLRKFRPPTYEPHTQFMKKVIGTIVPQDEQFDLYSHSGGGIMAKNLLHDPDISRRVTNAVFLNPAGTTTMSTLFPVLFRRTTLFRSIGAFIRDLPHVLRYTFERDRNEKAHNAAFWYRDRVTVAIQSGSHYRQPGWDTMRVNGGTVVLYAGGNDTAVGGKSFARFMEHRLRDTANPPPSPIALEYDRHAHHVTPFTHPEDVIDALFTKHLHRVPQRS